MKDDYYQKLGWVLKSQREIRKYTVKKTAKWLGVTPQQLCKYESGENRIPVDRLVKFCDLVNIEVSWVIEWAKKVK